MPQLAISALVQIRIFDGFIADGSCGSICAVQAVVFAADSLVGVPVKGHSQHDFLRRDPLVQIGLDTGRNAGFTLGGSSRGRVQRGIKICIRVPGPVEIISHEENMVHNVCHLHRLDLVEIPGTGGACNRQGIGFAIPAALSVQLATQFLKQQCEILLVCGAVDGAGGTAGDRVLPVQVHAIQPML